ncbi:MAG: prephenate dehydrogenase [Bryobacteraceae bacterium]
MNSVSIFGVGLIGGSFALALREAGFAGRIIGVSSPRTIALAIERCVIDEGATLEEAAKADLVFLAQPISVILETLTKLSGHLGPGTIVTDAGSTKVEIVARAAKCLPRERFVGGHPMAGKEVTGLSAAEAGLFRGRPWILTDSGPAADLVRLWVERFGARPFLFTADEHDRTVAMTSHLPQFLSTALALTLADCARASEISGPGAADMLRLALSSADLWRDIAATNATNIRFAIDRYIEVLQKVQVHLTDEAMDERFSTASTTANRLRKF